MKKTILLVACWLLSWMAFAQTEPNNLVTHEDYDQWFSELEMEKITTGVLVDKTIILSDLEAYNGNNDTAIADLDYWQQQYLEFYNASFDRQQIVKLDTLKNIVRDFIVQYNQFPLLMLNYDYSKFVPDAISQGLIEIDSLDTKKILDKSGEETLYTEHQLFTVSLPLKKWNGDSVNIYIGEEF